MQKLMIVSNGKRYQVTIPTDDGIYSCAANGTVWLQNTNSMIWYEALLSGSSASAQLYVNQTPLVGASPGNQEYGYQLLKSTDNNVYKVFLTGSTGQNTMSISTTAWSSNADYKTVFVLRSITDNYYYNVYASGSGAGARLLVDQNSKMWLA